MIQGRFGLAMNETAGTLLVVDDDGDIRGLFELWLSETYEVRTAADGVEALERVDEAVDVVVLDREMPRKDGVAVARELRSGPLSPAVVMVSGVAPGPDLLDVPVDDYCRKPVTRETVLDAVDRASAAAECDAVERHRRALSARLATVEAHADPDVLDASDAHDRAAAVLEGLVSSNSPPTSRSPPGPTRNAIR